MQIIKLLIILSGLFISILGFINLFRIIFKDTEYSFIKLITTIGIILIGITLITLFLFNNF